MGTLASFFHIANTLQCPIYTKEWCTNFTKKKIFDHFFTMDDPSQPLTFSNTNWDGMWRDHPWVKKWSKMIISKVFLSPLGMVKHEWILGGAWVERKWKVGGGCVERWSMGGARVERGWSAVERVWSGGARVVRGAWVECWWNVGGAWVEHGWGVGGAWMEPGCLNKRF